MRSVPSDNPASRLSRSARAVLAALSNRSVCTAYGQLAQVATVAWLNTGPRSSFAYVLMHALRRLGAEGTQFARVQCATLRLKLLKIGARVKVTARRIWLSFSQAYPYAETFTQVLANLQRAPLWNPSG